MTDEERDKLIIETHQDVKWIKEGFFNHLEHHRKYMYFTMTTCIGLIITLIILLIK